ncbi:hypothetical protein LTR57_012930 [Friedmanniomyces endolithicus]|nr:hypothetical protein LTR75_000313 [Friedmanniomyces endolithicus]KAK0856848.1 hypothetical protein LTS02_010450 [Friedmanniomyces endolithicus]KAK0882116.1 hypothetical protein LTR87_004071 [Friedmanniomyces endolithicus]KAK0916478.1 hypothetical protein LTR57_012930 [Friedmanniomyces endolithicus]KAK1074753.1 hypothetical protein LTR33_009703 [Friedmanniomyces endolithicus]
MESTAAPGSAPDPEAFLDRVLDFDGNYYERLIAMTDYRRDPGEARILYLCRRLVAGGASMVVTDSEETFVMKVKIQVPPRPASDDPREPLPGPSATTAAEIAALRKFQCEDLDGVPHLIATKCSRQGTNGPFPGGYISYIVMTAMPGRNLMASMFWSLDDAVKEEIRDAFITLLKSIWRLGIAPYDCALRNIIWDSNARRCSVVDFEHYEAAKDPINMTEREEMQRWGIVQRPPPSHWAVEWGLYKDP